MRFSEKYHRERPKKFKSDQASNVWTPCRESIQCCNISDCEALPIGIHRRRRRDEKQKATRPWYIDDVGNRVHHKGRTYVQEVLEDVRASTFASHSDVIQHLVFAKSQGDEHSDSVNLLLIRTPPPSEMEMEIVL